MMSQWGGWSAEKLATAAANKQGAVFLKQCAAASARLGEMTSIIVPSASIPAARQNRSKLARTSATLRPQPRSPANQPV